MASPNERDDDQHLFNVLNKMLNDKNIDLSNYRSQSYDNAGNMSSLYSLVHVH